MNSKNRIMFVVLFLFATIFSCDKNEFEREVLLKDGDVSAGFTTANITGYIIDSGEGIDECGHVISLNEEDFNEYFESENLIDNHKYTTEIYNIKSGARYYLKAYAREGDKYTYGEVGSLYTKNINNHISVDVLSTSYRSMKIKLELKSDDILQEFDEIGCCWSDNSIPTILNDSCLFTTGDTVNVYNVQIENLKVGTKYNVSVFFKADSSICYSKEIEISTKDYQLPEVELMSVTDITDTTAIVQFYVKDFGGYDSLKTSCVDLSIWYTFDSYRRINIGSVDELGVITFKVDNLFPAHKYIVRIFAENGKGHTFSEKREIRTTYDCIVQEGLYLYYPFDGDLRDYSGYMQNSVAFGALLAEDRFKRKQSAYYFDGIDDYINLPFFTQECSDYSISLWVNPEDTNMYSETGKQVLLHMKMFPHKTIQWNESSNSIEYVCGEKTWKVELNSPENSISINNWYHIYVELSNDTLKLFVNGLDVMKAKSKSCGCSDCRDGLYLGTRKFYKNEYFKGKIDDVRIYNRPLTEEEINELYHEGGWEE